MKNEKEIKLEKIRESGDFRVFVKNRCCFRLIRTCEFSPEQYDIYSFIEGKNVAYIRLRWGCLSCVDQKDDTDIYYECIDGYGGFTGSFEEEKDRIKYLTEIIESYLSKYRDIYLEGQSGETD